MSGSGFAHCIATHAQMGFDCLNPLGSRFVRRDFQVSLLTADAYSEVFSPVSSLIQVDIRLSVLWTPSEEVDRRGLDQKWLPF